MTTNRERKSPSGRSAEAATQSQAELQEEPAHGFQKADTASEAAAAARQAEPPIASPLSGPRDAPSELSLPLASRAVFWKPRHSENARSLLHVPFLFWLMESARPTHVVHLGLGDPVAYLALCQAADRLRLETVCMGVDLTPDKTALSSVLAEQHATLYGDFSFVVAEEFARAARHVRRGRIDLLVIDTALSDEHLTALRAHWMPLLSDKAVLVVQNPTTFLSGSEARQYIDSLIHAQPSITFPQAKPGLEVVLVGSQQPELLLRMAELDLGSPGYLAAQQVFARLGKGLESEQISKLRRDALNRATTDLGLLEARLATLEAELAQERQIKQAALQSEADQAARVATLLAQIFDLRTALETARPATAEAAEPIARRDTALAQTARQLEKIQHECAALCATLEGQRAEVMALTRTAEEYRTALEQARADIFQKEEEILALRTSTSWKVTAPLRKAKLAFTGRQRRPEPK